MIVKSIGYTEFALSRGTLEEEPRDKESTLGSRAAGFGEIKEKKEVAIGGRGRTHLTALEHAAAVSPIRPDRAGNLFYQTDLILEKLVCFFNNYNIAK